MEGRLSELLRKGNRETIMIDLIVEVISNGIALVIVLACIYFPLRWAFLFTQHLEKKWGK
jgi:hypothetical protein